MPRISATDRLGRILAIVPWIAEAGSRPIDEVCERFGLSRAQLLDDLAVIPFVGRYPYTPENLIELDIDDDEISIRYTNFFERPLRLSRDEALALLASGTAALGQVGTDPDGPLARGLRKLADALDIDLEDDLRVVLGGDDDLLATVRRAVEDRRAIDIGYYSHARNEQTQRVIEPLRAFHTEGAWYVSAFCRSSQAERVFRIDRITDARVLDERVDRPAPSDAPSAFDAADLPRVVLEVDRDGTWVADHYPVEARTELPDGGARVTLAVSALPWLERVLLRLGPHGRVVDGPDELRAAATSAARRVLAVYRS